MSANLWILLALSWIHVSRATGENQTCENEGKGESSIPSSSCLDDSIDPLATSQPLHKCTLFVAPSTTPNAGVGVFTAIPLHRNDIVPTDGDVIVPFADLTFFQEEDDYFNPFDDFVWDATSFGIHLEAQSSHSVQAYAPGILSLANAHSSLNIKRGDFEYDTNVGGHRSVSPSAGSMTPYVGSETVVTQDIEAGGELFISYGSGWWESRNESPDGVQQMRPVDHGDSKIRSLDQLQSTGRCMDAIEYGQSTLPWAGRGAFASRDFSKGQIITGSPLIHVPYESLVYLYAFAKDGSSNGGYLADFDTMTGYQLVMNYCLSHAETPMLLCPYGAGVNYINHNQTQANVRLQWAPDGVLNQDDSWLHKSPYDMEYEFKTHLAIDFVAIRDIREGEELYLDYGNEWEEAWQEYVQEWEPPERRYISASVWNLVHANDPLRTEKEQDLQSYPDNLRLRCHPSVYFGNYDKLQIALQDTEELWPSKEKGLACDVHSRSKSATGEVIYTVHVYNPTEDRAVTRREVERRMIQMVDAPYTTDWHRRDSFRHYIGVPDDIFPTAWKFNATDFEDNEDFEDDEGDVDESEEEEEEAEDDDNDGNDMYYT